MAAFLSPGVFTQETTIGALPSASGAIIPAFVGTAKKGPMNTPTLITSAQQYIDTFGELLPESTLGYAVLGFFENGGQCYVIRVGVESALGLDDALAAVAVDTSGAKIDGWGRIALFAGIDYGRINLRAVTADDPVSFHVASVSTPAYNQADVSSTHGATTASLAVTGAYTGSIDDAFTLVITSDPDLSSGAAISGASFEVVRGSDGETVADGTLTEAILGQSQAISVGSGLTVRVHVSAGVLAINDTFTFTVRPDNRKFTVAVEGVDGSEYTMPSATYATTAQLVTAINNLLSSEHWAAVSATLSDDSVVPQLRTSVAGRWLQIAGTAAWAAEVGESQYAFDIPRAYLIGTNAEPYTITTQRNQIVMNVIDRTSTSQVNVTIATGTNITAAQLAANLDPAGVVGGTRMFDAIALTVPGGTQLPVMITTTDFEFAQLQLLASYSNLKSLRFAEEVGIAFPYQRSYRGYTDARLSLPAASAGDAAVPASCDDDPLGADCAADSAYYANVVGWLVATSPGTWLDNYTLSLALYTGGVGDPAGRYQITITDPGGVVVDRVADVSFDKRAARYIGNVINPGSAVGGAAGNAFVNWSPRPDALDYDTALASYDVRQPAALNSAFGGTANGIPTDPAMSSELDSAIIGNPALSSGIFAMQNPETYPINLLVTPGFSSGPVIAQCLQMCEARGDVIYLVDPPFGLRPQQVTDWHNGMLLSDLAAAINSSHGALYWSWIEVFDQFNSQNIWVPPAGHVAGVFSRTSRVAQLWRAPAGITRGRLLTALDVEYTPSQPERNLLYGNNNAVNPIVKFPKSGITVYGQKTLLRSESVLNRVDAKMLTIYLKQGIAELLNQYVFEPNDSILWSQIKNTIEPYLANVQGLRGLSGFAVVCDESNNTKQRQASRQLWVTVFIQPTLSAEFIVLNMVSLAPGASFSSQEALAAGGIISNA